jgi:hypothetical protein
MLILVQNKQHAASGLLFRIPPRGDPVHVEAMRDLGARFQLVVYECTETNDALLRIFSAELHWMRTVI